MYRGGCGLRVSQDSLCQSVGLCPTQLVTWLEPYQYYYLPAVGYGQGWLLSLVNSREDFRIALASTDDHMIEQTPQNGCCQCLCPTGSSICLLPFPETLQRPAGRSSLDSFQITASSLCHGTCGLLFVPFKAGISVSHLLTFKGKHSRDFVSQCRTSRLGSLMYGSDLLLLENLCIYTSLLSVDHSSQGYGSQLYHNSIPPTCLTMVPSLYLQL